MQYLQPGPHEGTPSPGLYGTSVFDQVMQEYVILQIYLKDTWR